MQVIVKGKNLTVSDRMRELIDKHAGNLGHFFDAIDKLEATLESQKHGHAVEVLISARKLRIISEGDGKTIWEAIDAAFDKAKRNLKKQKEKMTEHRRRGSESQAATTEIEVEQEKRGIVS